MLIAAPSTQDVGCPHEESHEHLCGLQHGDDAFSPSNPSKHTLPPPPSPRNVLSLLWDPKGSCQPTAWGAKRPSSARMRCPASRMHALQPVADAPHVPRTSRQHADTAPSPLHSPRTLPRPLAWASTVTSTPTTTRAFPCPPLPPLQTLPTLIPTVHTCYFLTLTWHELGQDASWVRSKNNLTVLFAIRSDSQGWSFANYDMDGSYMVPVVSGANLTRNLEPDQHLRKRSKMAADGRLEAQSRPAKSIPLHRQLPPACCIPCPL